MKKAILLSCATIAILSGCGSAEEDVPSPAPPTPSASKKTEISIVTTLPERPVPLPFGEESAERLRQGDQAGLYIVSRAEDNGKMVLATTGNYIDNRLYTYDNGWTTTPKAYWKYSVTHADFYFYTPFTQNIVSVKAMPFSVSTNQSTEAAHRSSDLMIGNALDASPTGANVRIALRHAMSLLRIRLEAGKGFKEEDLANAVVSINGTKNNATVDIATASVTPTGQSAPISPMKTVNGYEAFIIPQDIGESDIITVTIDGETHTLRKAISLLPGNEYTCTVTISKTNTGFSADIMEWDNDGTDYGGTAQ